MAFSGPITTPTEQSAIDIIREEQEPPFDIEQWALLFCGHQKFLCRLVDKDILAPGPKDVKPGEPTLVFDLIEQVSGAAMVERQVQYQLALVPFEDVNRPAQIWLIPHLVMPLSELQGKDKDIWSVRIQQVLKARGEARRRREMRIVSP